MIQSASNFVNRTEKNMNLNDNNDHHHHHHHYSSGGGGGGGGGNTNIKQSCD
jgi:hypothetical protein